MIPAQVLRFSTSLLLLAFRFSTAWMKTKGARNFLMPILPPLLFFSTNASMSSHLWWKRNYTSPLSRPRRAQENTKHH
ncbi:hypothetical protein CPB83DRAFT_862945 [Crepidotus variabilis]|uniref:Uncharacterized protein n=1 Tax=Crepidotus variabilis TaxID=179855 RepID=A0A9P6E6B9_9AGAR|nr:hypothetical protein CPB83DRAFT_862945 [Crepidotus variabilis]